MSVSDIDERPGRLQLLIGFFWALVIHVLFILLAFAGAVTIYGMVQNYRAGEIGLGPTIGFGLFGLVLITVGVGFFYVAYVGAPRFLGRLEQRREGNRDQPWMANRQWRSRRLVHSNSFTVWFMWFWTICWWAIIALMLAVNGDLILADLRGTWSQAIGTMLPIIGGVLGLLVAISVTWQHLRYGNAVLTMDTLPGFLGQNFRGTVLAGTNGRLNEPAILTLTCASLTSEMRHGTDGWETVWITDEIWSAVGEIHPTQTIHSRGRTALPVAFDLPENLPESGDILDDPQIIWTLTVSPGSVLDKSVACSFNVPVYAARPQAET